jgi:FkbM family methyltransferase
MSNLLSELTAVLAGIARHPSPPLNRAMAVGRFAFRQAWKRILRRPMDVQWQGLKLRVHSDSSSAAKAYYLGFPDFWEFVFLSRLLRPGDEVVDVGANVGVYTLFLADRVLPGGQVVAFEPDDVNLERLHENLHRNQFDHVRVEPSAVGDRCGEGRFLAGQDSVGHLADVPADAGRVVTVAVTTLDASLGDLTPIFCKVDVEGHEEAVVAGAQLLMRRGYPVVWQLEVNSDHGGLGAPGSSLAKLLRTSGYGLYSFDPWRATLTAVSGPTGESNLLAIRDVSEVERRLAQEC